MASANLNAAYRGYKADGATTTTHALSLDVQEPTRRAFIDRVMARDRTNGGATCNVYINSGGALYLLATLTLTSADQWYGAQVQTWVYAGESLQFNFASVVAADILTVAAIGKAEVE